MLLNPELKREMHTILARVTNKKFRMRLMIWRIKKWLNSKN